MKKLLMNGICALIFLSVCSSTTFGQFKPHFVNMTELGGLFGRVLYDIQWAAPQQSEVKNRLNLTVQTFNGLQLKPRLAIGATVGIDWYNTALLMPLAAGVRYDLTRPRKNVSLYGSMDAGYSTHWLHADATGYRTRGGMMLNPGVGLKIGLKAGSALIVSMTYKRQAAKVTQPLGWQELVKYEDRVYNRMALRIGVMF